MANVSSLFRRASRIPAAQLRTDTVGSVISRSMSDFSGKGFDDGLRLGARDRDAADIELVGEVTLIQSADGCRHRGVARPVQRAMATVFQMPPQIVSGQCPMHAVQREQGQHVAQTCRHAPDQGGQQGVHHVPQQTFLNGFHRDAGQQGEGALVVTTPDLAQIAKWPQPRARRQKGRFERGEGGDRGGRFAKFPQFSGGLHRDENEIGLRVDQLAAGMTKHTGHIPDGPMPLAGLLALDLMVFPTALADQDELGPGPVRGEGFDADAVRLVPHGVDHAEHSPHQLVLVARFVGGSTRQRHEGSLFLEGGAKPPALTGRAE